MIATVGSFVLAAGILISIVNFSRSLRHGAPAGRNPWLADTLEWSTESPPPPYGSVHIPTVTTRHPLWDDWEEELDPRGERILDQGRLTLASSALDAEPVALSRMPEDSITPLLMALAMTLFFTAVLLKLMWAAVGGVILVAAVNAVWLWPQKVRRLA
jgi:hypothetical protein